MELKDELERVQQVVNEAVNAVAELQKMAESEPTDFESKKKKIIEIAQSMSPYEVSELFTSLGEECTNFRNCVSEAVEEAVDNDDDIVRKDDIDVELVYDIGLEKDVFRNHWDNMSSGELRDFVKEAIDSI